jgi:hypothetical protein
MLNGIVWVLFLAVLLLAEERGQRRGQQGGDEFECGIHQTGFIISTAVRFVLRSTCPRGLIVAAHGRVPEWRDFGSR